MRLLPAEPAELDTSNAAALAETAGRVFEYLAELARAAATLAEQSYADACQLAEIAPEGDERDQAEDYARQAAESADTAAAYVLETDALAEAAAERGILGSAAEDIEPAALAEVAEAITRAMWQALAAVATGNRT